jgi:hypothetical protein
MALQGAVWDGHRAAKKIIFGVAAGREPAPSTSVPRTRLSPEERMGMDQAQKLRDLASWYREFAERAENPAIWDARLRTAEDLEREAGNLEHQHERRLAKAS